MGSIYHMLAPWSKRRDDQSRPVCSRNGVFMPTHLVPLCGLPFLGTSLHLRCKQHEGLFRQQRRREVVLDCSVDDGNPSALAKVQ